MVEAGEARLLAPRVTLAAGVARAESPQARAPGPPPVDVRARRSEWDLRARVARFEGDVVLVRGEFELRADRLEVRYRDADRIEGAVAEGGVTVTRGGRVARAARAELVADGGVVTLTGGPTLAEGPNRLLGERITLFLDDERATCEGGGETPCRLVVEGSALR